METELWPNMLTQAQAANIPVVLINARLSTRSWRRKHYLKSFFTQQLQKLTAIGVQSYTEGKRFSHLGVHPDKLHITGNLKLDIQIKTLRQKS